MKTYNIAVVGVTGLVGKELLKLLENFPISKLKLFASKKSEGTIVTFKKTNIIVETLKCDSFKNIDFSFFCTKASISKKFIPQAIKESVVIDLSSAYRMYKNIPLVIPEINSHTIKKHNRLICSPNCTTTIMLMALYPLNKVFKIKRIVTSTYQAASGGGKKLMDKLITDTTNHLKNKLDNSFYGFNLFLHDSSLSSCRYSEEELKMSNETKKILENKNINVTATCVRVPVLRAHSMSLNIEFHKTLCLEKIYFLLQNTPNLKIVEDFSKNKFITPAQATKTNHTYVSRIRIDPSQKNTLEMWVVADQLLKGAALNAYQIALHFIKKD